MKERGMLFGAPMVLALLDGRKTQTRRVLKGSTEHCAPYNPEYLEAHRNSPGWASICPYGKPGDRLYVRETWRHTALNLEEARAITEDIMSGTAVDWRADYVERMMRDAGFAREDAEMACDFETWRPSIHMPRWASRIDLEITGVRVERLQDISRGDAMDEGCPFPNMAQGDDPRKWYAELWESINGPGSWAANPWVWVIDFRRVKP